MVKLTENLAPKICQHQIWQKLHLTRGQTRNLQAPVAAGTLPIFCQNFSWYYIIYICIYIYIYVFIYIYIERERGNFLCGPEDGIFTHRMTIGHMIHQDMVRGTLFSKPYGLYPLLTMDGIWIEPKLGENTQRLSMGFTLRYQTWLAGKCPWPSMEGKILELNTEGYVC